MLQLRKQPHIRFQILGILGLMICIYSIYVEKQKALNPQYEALCDINPGVQCSKALTSENSHLFQIFFPEYAAKYPTLNQSNAVYGLLFYTAILMYPLFPFTLIPFREYLLLFASTASVSLSVYLAHVLYEMGDLCLVCTSIYIVNAFTFLFAIQEWRFANISVIQKSEQKKD